MEQASFPSYRARRLRRNPGMRALIRETKLSPEDFIWPIFVSDHNPGPVASMPGVSRLTSKEALAAARKAIHLGIRALCLFPSPDPAQKTEDCAVAWQEDNLLHRLIAEIKSAEPDLLIMTDVALDPYNANGHDGIVREGKIMNDETVEALARMALTQANAGADILGPSDMMDGRIGAIRQVLESEGHQDVAILSYSAKYASSFYGPFRDAVGASGRLSGDKATYQMDPANASEAERMIARDLSEGADMVMVKPGLAYLDICARIKQRFNVPLFAYQVSGEYAMIEAAAANGWLDRERVIMESLIAFKRAGCDGILSYYAPEIAVMLAEA